MKVTAKGVRKINWAENWRGLAPYWGLGNAVKKVPPATSVKRLQPDALAPELIKGPTSATVQSSWRYWTRGRDTWMGVELATSSNSDMILFARECSVSQPPNVVPIDPVEVWVTRSVDRNWHQERNVVFCHLLSLQMILVLSPLRQHALYSPPAPNLQAACMLTDRQKTTAALIIRGKNLPCQVLPFLTLFLLSLGNSK